MSFVVFLRSNDVAAIDG